MPAIRTITKPLIAALIALTALTGAVGAPAPALAGPTLDRITGEGVIRLGYRADAAPFASEADGKAGGFTVELCVAVARLMGKALGISNFEGMLVRVDTTDRFNALERGEIDLLCGATTATLERRARVDFSIPTFATGVGAAVKSDAPELMREILITDSPAAASRAAVAEALKGRALGVRAGTTAAAWLENSPIADLEQVSIIEIADHGEAIAKLRDGALDAYFADQAILGAQIAKAGAEGEISLSQKTFTHEPYALAMPKGDSELRLEVDRALSQIYRSGSILSLYSKYFGAPGGQALLFYALTPLPE